MVNSLVLLYYTASLAFAVLVLKIYRIRYISPPGLFIAFSLLYSLFPYLAHIEIVPNIVGSLSLFQRSDLIQIHLINVGSSVYAFMLSYMLIFRKSKHLNIYMSKGVANMPCVMNNRDRMIIILYIIISILVMILGRIYPWGGWGGGGVDFEPRPSLVNSFLGHGKLLMSIIIIYFAVFFKNFKLIVLLIIPFILVVIVEGARTSLAITLLTLLLLWSKDRKSDYLEAFKISIILVSSIAFLIFIAFYRIGAEASGLEIFDLLYPIYFEGMYGSYMCLQIYELITVSKVLNQSFGMHILLDPLVFLIPRFLFVIFGEDKDNFTLYNNFSNSAESHLTESLGPYGGFYFIADAHLAFPFIGPFLLSLLFGWVTAVLEHKSTISTLHKSVFYFYLVSFFITFVKHQVSQSIHFLFVTVILCAILYFFSNIKRRYLMQSFKFVN
jgi:hypothetical protein